MKTFVIVVADHLNARALVHVADEWKIQDGFVMFTCHESSVPVFAIRADLVFSIEVQDDS